MSWSSLSKCSRKTSSLILSGTFVNRPKNTLEMEIGPRKKHWNDPEKNISNFYQMAWNPGINICFRSLMPAIKSLAYCGSISKTAGRSFTISGSMKHGAAKATANKHWLLWMKNLNQWMSNQLACMFLGITLELRSYTRKWGIKLLAYICKRYLRGQDRRINLILRPNGEQYNYIARCPFRVQVW